MITLAHGGFDLYFTFVPNDSLTIKVETDIQVRCLGTPSSSGLYSIEISTGIDTVSGKAYVYFTTYQDAFPIDVSSYPFNSSAVPASIDVRVFSFDGYMAICMNNVWVYTYAFINIVYNIPVGLKLKVEGTTATITNIRSVELCDGRQAVYVDYESTGDDGISSIVQERPVEIFPESNRSMSFTYRVVEDSLTPYKVTSYDHVKEESSNAASDALVYYENVGITISEATLKELGFITRLYRLSDLESGAIFASRRMQQVALENVDQVTIEGRFDPRVEHDDLLLVSKNVSGTNSSLVDNVIIDKIDIALADGDFSMIATGRRQKNA